MSRRCVFTGVAPAGLLSAQQFDVASVKPSAGSGGNARLHSRGSGICWRTGFICNRTGQPFSPERLTENT